MNKGYEGVYIVGAGQAVYRKGATEPVHRILWEAMNNGLSSASLDWKQVDGLAVSAFVLPPDNVTVVAEHFGLAPRWLFQGVYGGASGVIGMLHAARAIPAGDADVVAWFWRRERHFCLAYPSLHGSIRCKTRRFWKIVCRTTHQCPVESKRAV